MAIYPALAVVLSKEAPLHRNGQPLWEFPQDCVRKFKRMKMRSTICPDGERGEAGEGRVRDQAAQTVLGEETVMRQDGREEIEIVLVDHTVGRLVDQAEAQH